MDLEPAALQALQQVHTFSIQERPHKVSVADFVDLQAWRAQGHVASSAAAHFERARPDRRCRRVCGCPAAGPRRHRGVRSPCHQMWLEPLAHRYDAPRLAERVWCSMALG